VFFLVLLHLLGRPRPRTACSSCSSAPVRPWTTRLWVLIIIMVVIGALLLVGYAPDVAVTVVVAGGLAAAEVARRLLGPPRFLIAPATD
jgi:multisubunit Na+/H+ antiporter MnhB subunit